MTQLSKYLEWEKSKYLILPLLVIFIFYLLMDKLIMKWYTRHGQSVEVPHVVEMTFEGARTLLEQNDLKIVEEAKKFDKNYRAGIIISQNPKPYAQVKKRRRVYVIVSKGEPTVEMTPLIGNSEKNAIFEIRRLGLQLRYTMYEYSEHFPDGVVIDQSIPIGKEVKLGEFIDLIVSMGRPPDRFIVPDLIGRSLSDAKQIIQKAGLTLGNVTYQIENDLLPETTIAQSLTPNTEVSQGDTVNILVSKLQSTPEDNYE